jgi:threonine synthase
MRYYSLQQKAHTVSFEQAIREGLAPDGGLYFPEHVTPLPASFFDNIEQLSREAMAFEAIQPFVGDAMPADALRRIIAETLDFDFPLEPVGENIYSLELFHGPTLAFKDVGARFMSRCLGYFNRDNPREVTVLVATSGDTGSAVAHGFYNVPGINVVILYPSGKVSAIQAQQLTTLGGNITALEVAGVFDDCQAWVKKAFNDPDLKTVSLTSANSINIARWMPQMFYYFFTYAALKHLGRPLVVSCPSGNFGNICAGMLAQRLGLPIERFIAAQNANDTVHRFLKTGAYNPLPTVATVSNAMDVSAPSNWVRILELYGHDVELLRKNLVTYRFSDEENIAILQKLYREHGYIADPHGALGYEALKLYLQENPGSMGAFLETAHPVKFADTIETALQQQLALPPALGDILQREKKSVCIGSYDDLKNQLLK